MTTKRQGMSERQYATHAGVSRPTVATARMLGRLVHYPDGSIDAEASDRRRAETTDPAMQRGRQSIRQVPEAAVAAVSETSMSYMEARAANEVLKTELRKIQVRKLAGELVDRTKACALVFGLARAERDAWLGWPVRVAAGMAAELGADPHRLQTVLENHVRQHLAGLAEIKIDLR
ncbi:MAG: elements of external origin [Rhodospirillales bacterium]